MSVERNELPANSDENKVKEKEKKTDNVGENFIAPDGGWGWIIVIAAGFSNFCILPVLQSFGLIFRDRFAELGITSSQTTTIININCTVMSCIGLANGPLFRKFSYRQVSFIGALICAISITILSTMTSFAGCLVFFSILYGVGIGITMSANALALNTYFKKKRRIATGFSWTCTGMGPILMPQIITQLMPIYGVEGTVLIFGGVAFNAVACALLLQPVELHVKKGPHVNEMYDDANIESKGLPTFDQEITETAHQNHENTFQSRSLKDIADSRRNSLNVAKGKFGSQYLYYDDEENGPSGVDVLEPGTPMISQANDGWPGQLVAHGPRMTSFSLLSNTLYTNIYEDVAQAISIEEELMFSKKNPSTISLTSKASIEERSVKNSRSSMSLSRQSGISEELPVRTLARQNGETENFQRKISNDQPSEIPLIVSKKSRKRSDSFERCKDSNSNERLERSPMIIREVGRDQSLKEERNNVTTKKTFLEAFIIFFDLDLLRDLVYVNIMLGMTFATFSEMNFSLLTPFILSEYGYTKIQVATYMSILAGVDVATRLIIPFIADLLGWQNRTFFLVGVCGMAAGRVVVAHIQNFEVVLVIAVLFGAAKGLRTIFVALVIPTHVPLSRLPGATGIQLLTNGIVYLALGPVVGWIRDVTSDYGIMLHCLNVFTYLITIAWLLEYYFVKRKARRLAKKEDAAD